MKAPSDKIKYFCQILVDGNQVMAYKTETGRVFELRIVDGYPYVADYKKEIKDYEYVRGCTEFDF